LQLSRQISAAAAAAAAARAVPNRRSFPARLEPPGEKAVSPDLLPVVTMSDARAAAPSAAAAARHLALSAPVLARQVPHNAACRRALVASGGVRGRVSGISNRARLVGSARGEQVTPHPRLGLSVAQLDQDRAIASPLSDGRWLEGVVCGRLVVYDQRQTNDAEGGRGACLRHRS
jgi:hypothetical protein